MSVIFDITLYHDGAGLLDEFGPDSEWAYWFDDDFDWDSGCWGIVEEDERR